VAASVVVRDMVTIEQRLRGCPHDVIVRKVVTKTTNAQVIH